MYKTKPTPEAVRREMEQILEEQLHRQYLAPMPKLGPPNLDEIWSFVYSKRQNIPEHLRGMAAGVTDRLWELEDLVRVTDEYLEAQKVANPGWAAASN